MVAIAWIYVVLMMAVAEATSSTGSVLGALVTFVLYGVMPLGIVMYVMGTPGRARARRARGAKVALDTGPGLQPDGSGHAPGDTVTSERKEA